MGGTQRLEKFATSEAPAMGPIATPIAELSPAVLAAARGSLAPAAPEPIEAKVEQADAKVEQADAKVEPEQLRTRLARKFTTLADVVTESFGDFHIGAGSWIVELTAPSGMSTSGGKQALQHLRLRPRRQGHAVLVGGVVNAVAKTAELRDYPHMVMIHRARFGCALEISAGEWEQFLRKAEVLLRVESIRTSRVSAPRDVVALAAESMGIGWQRKAAMIALGVIVFLLTLLAWRIALVVW